MGTGTNRSHIPTSPHPGPTGLRGIVVRPLAGVGPAAPAAVAVIPALPSPTTTAIAMNRRIGILPASAARVRAGRTPSDDHPGVHGGAHR